MSWPLRAGLAFLLLAPLGCSRESAEAPQKVEAAGPVASDQVSGIYAKSWVGQVAKDPAALQKLLDADPEKAWVKLHSRDYPAAQSAFSGMDSPAGRLGLARAHLEDAELFAMAYELALDVEQRFVQMRAENAGRLKQSALDLYTEAVIALRRGESAEALKQIRAFRSSGQAESLGLVAAAMVLEGEALKQGGDAAGAEALWKSPQLAKNARAAALLSLARGEVPGTLAADNLYARRLQFWALADRGELDRARELLPELEPRQPDVTEELSGSGETTTRQFFDPGLLKAYSRFNARAGLAALEAGEGLGAVYRARLQTLAGETAAAAAAPTQLDEAALPGLLFGNFPTLADVAPEGQGLIAQFLKDAGPLPTGESDGSDTRKVVQLAQSYRDAANKVVKELATGEGATAVAGLKLVERDISLAVMARARLYREQGRLAEALFLFEHVLDKDNVQVNYLNDPILFLELTRTYVMIGRHREALNYLAKLTQARPELWSIQEAIGNLSVLGTVDQAGRTGQQD